MRGMLQLDGRCWIYERDVCVEEINFDGMLSGLLFVLELERRVRARQSP